MYRLLLLSDIIEIRVQKNQEKEKYDPPMLITDSRADDTNLNDNIAQGENQIGVESTIV